MKNNSTKHLLAQLMKQEDEERESKSKRPINPGKRAGIVDPNQARDNQQDTKKAGTRDPNLPGPQSVTTRKAYVRDPNAGSQVGQVLFGQPLQSKDNQRQQN